MKKLLVLVGLFVPAVMCASTIFIDHSNYNPQSFELTRGISHTVSLGDSVELRVLDTGDSAASVFKLTVVRLDGNGMYATLCENQLKVPFGSEATLVFSKIGFNVRFVASVPDATITPDPSETPGYPTITTEEVSS